MQSLSKKIKDKVHCYSVNSVPAFLIIRSLTQHQKLHISFLSVMLGLKDDKNAHKDNERPQGQENSSAYKKYEYGHLDCWYNKSTLHQRFLN